MTTTPDWTLGRLDGQLLLPGDVGYDEARTVWNAVVDRRPRMIIRCAGVDDVVTADGDVVRASQDEHPDLY